MRYSLETALPMIEGIESQLSQSNHSILDSLIAIRLSGLLTLNNRAAYRLF